jgi:hypothetical protein
MDVYAVFLVTGDTDDAAVYDLVAIAKSPQAADVWVRNNFDDADSAPDLVHASMNLVNQFTYHGPRNKTRPQCGYGLFGGYVVEAMPLFDVAGLKGPHFTLEKNNNVRTLHAQQQ